MEELIISCGAILFLIVVTCVFFFVCVLLFVSLSILQPTDISDTALGKSIVGNTYETMVPTSFEYSTYDTEKYNLTLWEDEPTLGNPKQWFFNVKLKPGIKFKVLKVFETIGIDSGTHLQIKIKLLDNGPLDMIDGYVEADIVKGDSKSEYKFPKYVHKNISESVNPKLVDIFDKKEGLHTKNLKLGLYGFQFFDYERDDIINRNAIKQKSDVIRKVK